MRRALPNITDIPKARMAMWWVVASEMVIFGGLICCYVLYRLKYPEWGESASHTSTTLGAINTFVLLTSSLTIALAHEAATQKRFNKIAQYMSFTILFAFMFLGIKMFEYSEKVAHGFTLTTNLFWSFYYLMTGLHAFHVIIGIFVMFLIMLQARKGLHLHRVEMVGLYWHLVDIVWIFLFPLLYVAQ